MFKFFSTLYKRLHFLLRHRIQLRKLLLYFATLDLVVVEVDVIKKVIAEGFMHVATIVCGYDGDGCELSGILL